MAFVKKTWVDRVTQFAGRRKLINVDDGTQTVVDIERNEGTVTREGDKFNAENMNDLEERIYDTLYEVTKTYTDKSVEAELWSTYTATLEQEDQIIKEYKYKADIALSGITAGHAVTVCFAPDDIADDVYASYVNSQSGKIRIYAKEKPLATLTIPTIYAIKKGV